MLKQKQAEVEAAQRELRNKVPEKLAAVIGEMRNLDCECRRKAAKDIRQGTERRIASASSAEEKLTAFIQTEYMKVAEKLTNEFRIFTGTNAAVFALLGLATLIKRRAGWHLVPPASALLVAALVTGYLYLFQQNWLHTIVFNDYVGLTYVAYLSLVFAWLCDILLNKASITTQVINAVLEGIGNSMTVSPC